MKKLLSTLLAVMLAVTMLTGMAIPAQAAENDIFNPGVLELDGSAAATFSKNQERCILYLYSGHQGYV